MSEIYNIYEAKTHLSELIERAIKGEKITIAKSGKPKVALIPVSAKRQPKRVPGRLKGKVWIAPDAFSPEVDAQIWADFDSPKLSSPKRKA